MVGTQGCWYLLIGYAHTAPSLVTVTVFLSGAHQCATREYLCMLYSCIKTEHRDHLCSRNHQLKTCNCVVHFEMLL